MAKSSTVSKKARRQKPADAPGKESADALQLLEQISMLHEQGTGEMHRYLQVLSGAAEDPNVSRTVQQGARVLLELLEVRGQERRATADMARVFADLLQKLKGAEGKWPQAAHDVDALAQAVDDEKTQELLAGIRTEIQRFIDTYLLSILQVLRDPLKSSELSALLKHYLEEGADDEEDAVKSALEAEVVLEAIRQKYAHPLLLVKNVIGPHELSGPARVLLNTFQEMSPDFPPLPDTFKSRRYLVKHYESDSFLGEDLKKAAAVLEEKGKELRGTKDVPAVEKEAAAEPEEEKKDGREEGQTETYPAPLALTRTVYRTHAARILDMESGSLAPGQSDLLDDAMEYVHRMWKAMMTWDPHPNYEVLRYYRDHMVRLLTMGQAMEFLLRGYRDVHRYHASDLVTLDTRKFLELPAVRELVSMMLYPRFERIPGFNTTVFQSLLGRQYGAFLRTCREITGLDVFVHEDWSGSLDAFLQKLETTYAALVNEQPKGLERLLRFLFRPV